MFFLNKVLSMAVSQLKNSDNSSIIQCTDFIHIIHMLLLTTFVFINTDQDTSFKHLILNMLWEFQMFLILEWHFLLKIFSKWPNFAVGNSPACGRDYQVVFSRLDVVDDTFMTLKGCLLSGAKTEHLKKTDLCIQTNSCSAQALNRSLLSPESVYGCHKFLESIGQCLTI